MDAAPDTRRQLGQLMVEEGLLSAEELAHALKEHSETGKPLGETLVALGYASPGAVANALAEQHGGLLRTEYGVSTGLTSVPDGERTALHAAPPVAPVSAPASTEHANESEAPLGAGLRLARPAASAPAEAPAATPTPAPAAPAPAPSFSEEQPPELAKFASLHADLDAARAELKEKSAHLIEVTGRLDETVSQLRISQTARDAFAAKAAELQAQTEAVTEPDPAQAARVQELEQSVADLQAKLTEAAEAAAGAQPDPAEAARVVELQTQVEELTKAVAAAEELGQAETARSQALEAQLQTVAAGRDSLAEQVAGLQAKLNEALEAPALASPGPDATARVEELEILLQAAAAERDALTRTVAELHEKTSAPTAPDPVLTARVQELEARLQATAAKRDALTRTVAELQEKADSPAAPDPVLTARVHDLEAQLAAREAEPGTVEPDPTQFPRMQELEARLQAATVERDGLVQSLTELQSRLGSTAEAREAEVARANAVAAARVIAVESQLQAAEAERNVLSQNVEVLQSLFSGTAAAHEAALAQLEEQLADRDQRLANHDDGTASIEREYRAALDQLELERNALAARFDELQGLMNETTSAHRTAFAKLEEQLAPVEPEETVHVLLVPAFDGYVLLERSGPAPGAREVVEIGPGSWGEGRFVVSRIGPSPLPSGPRRCAFLERA